MPAFFLHGVPDTGALWDHVRSHLARTDVLAPSMPGFGTSRPDGFDATKEAYAEWLEREVEAIGEPVDIVGHDWGSILVQRLVGTRPDLIRTWAVGSGPCDKQYVWHDMAQLWQTPDVGEQVMEGMTPDAIASFFVDELGADAATAMASRVDETMKRSVLSLYRSAITVGAEWEDDVIKGASTRPGLAIWGANDAYVPTDVARRLGERTGARVVIWDDAAHHWPVSHAERAARELEQLWNSVA